MLAELALRDQPVALIVADQRMPQMTGIELLEQSRVPRARAPSCCCSRRTPTPTSRSGRSTTSGSTTTCSSRGTRPRSGSTRCVDDLLDDWRQANPEQTSRRAGRRAPLVRPQPRDQDLPGPQPRALPLVRRRARRRGRSGCATWPAPTPTDLPLVLVPDGEPLRVADDAGPGRRARAAHHAPSSRCTTCASSAAARPGWPPRSTPRRRGCAPSSSSARRPAARPGRARRSRTTSGFPKGLTGADLTHRAVAQVARFGAEMVLARDVVGLETTRSGARRAASTAAARSRRGR